MAGGYEITIPSSIAIIAINMNYVYYVPGTTFSALCIISFGPKKTDFFFFFYHLWVKKTEAQGS